MPNYRGHNLYSVHPRYTSGSPGAVDRSQAERVVREEIQAYIIATTWGRDFVPEQTRLADEQGVAGIVFTADSTAKAWRIYDLITGWRGEIRFPKEPGENLRLAERVRLAQATARMNDIHPDWADTVNTALAATEGEPSPDLRQELERAVEETGGRFLSESETEAGSP